MAGFFKCISDTVCGSMENSAFLWESRIRPKGVNLRRLALRWFIKIKYHYVIAKGFAAPPVDLFPPPKVTQPCKLCKGEARIYGGVDFNKSCEENEGIVKIPPSGVTIIYHQCKTCGFLFSTAFDGLNSDDLKKYVYNQYYHIIDPDYAKIRPSENARRLLRLLAGKVKDLDILDYGGGNGILAQELLKGGAKSAQTYDPFVTELSIYPNKKFDVVVCFEVPEHTSDPMGLFRNLAGLVKDEGMVIFSTEISPSDAHNLLKWWYVAPRNGHISIFSERSLYQAWKQLGFEVSSANSFAYIAWKKPNARINNTLVPYFLNPWQKARDIHVRGVTGKAHDKVCTGV